MELFEQSGHLTDEALRLLTADALDELSRLEVSEHLSYCDRCLDRYLALLSDGALEMPEHTCAVPLAKRIRQGTIHALTSRYATAAAAIAIVIALWSGGGFGALVSLPAKLTAIPVSVSQSLEQTHVDAQSFFDSIGGWMTGETTHQTNFGGK